MLELSRRAGEQIVINKGQIEITVRYITNGHVGLGFKAHRGIEIDRKELFLAKEQTRLEEAQKKRLLSTLSIES
jgi:carbon storage regulator